MKEESIALEVVPPSALESIQRGEVDVQIATAHKYPRSMTQFKQRATAMATLDQETAESCIYVRPVGKENGKQKFAEGLSIRMAEIVGASYGNLRVGSMIVSQTERQVIARGYAHDLESNFAATSETIESTVGKDGNPYSERQRALIAKVALSKALRDATFKVVPRALCKSIETATRALIAGNGKSFEQRRDTAVQWATRLNIDMRRIWSALQVTGPDDLTTEHLHTLTGLKTAIKDGDVTVDEAFPAIIPQGKVGNPLDEAKPQPKKPAEDPKPVATPVSSSPTITELQASVSAKLAALNVTKPLFIDALVEQKLLPAKCGFAEISADTLAAVLDGWEDFIERLRNS